MRVVRGFFVGDTRPLCRSAACPASAPGSSPTEPVVKSEHSMGQMESDRQIDCRFAPARGTSHAPTGLRPANERNWTHSPTKQTRSCRTLLNLIAILLGALRPSGSRLTLLRVAISATGFDRPNSWKRNAGKHPQVMNQLVPYGGCMWGTFVCARFLDWSVNPRTAATHSD